MSDRPLNLVLIDGSRVSVSKSAFSNPAWPVRIAPCLAMSLLVLLVFDIASVRPHRPLPDAVLYYAILMVAWPALQLGVGLTARRLLPSSDDRILLLPLAGLATASVMTLATFPLSLLFALPEPETWGFDLGTAVEIYVVFGLLEAFCLMSAFGRQPSLRDRPEAPQTPERRNPGTQLIQTSDHKIELSDVLYLRANGHQTTVGMKTQTLQIRARLGDLVSQTEASDGLLLHRSYWVSYGAVASQHTEDGILVVKTIDGQEWPVARNKKKQVADLIEENIQGVIK